MRALSVVIPSKSTANFIKCAEAVRRLDPAAFIIAVDDGLDGDAIFSGIGDLMVPTSGSFRMRIYAVKGEKPFIFARNINIGLREGTGDDIVILNDDAILQTPGGFSLMQKTAEEHPDFGIIGATTNRVGNKNQYRMAPDGLREDPRMVCFIAVLIPRGTIEKVGLLDERFTGYGYEDDDYCARVRKAGLRIGICDGCFVDHASLHSSFRGDGYPHEAFERNHQLFLEKYETRDHGAV